MALTFPEIEKRVQRAGVIIIIFWLLLLFVVVENFGEIPIKHQNGVVRQFDSGFGQLRKKVTVDILIWESFHEITYEVNINRG